MRIGLNEWFTLPRLGREVFSDLMKARVKYDTKFGFKMTSGTEVTRALEILSGALEQQVVLESSCFICSSPLGEDVPDGSVICSKCRELDDAYSMYCMKFASFMDDVA